MAEANNQQIETTVQMDDTASEVSLEVPDMDDGPSGDTPRASGKLAFLASYCAFLLRIFAIFSCCSGDKKSATVSRVAGNLSAEIEEFIVGVRLYDKNPFSKELRDYAANKFRRLFSHWNTFLQQVQGIPDTSAIISSDTKNDINRFIQWQEEQGEQWTEEDKLWIKDWLPDWNMFLQAHAGETLVTRCSVFLTIVGFIFYIFDLVSDIGTSVYYAASGQWWRAMATLTIVYGAVIIQAVVKWLNGDIHCTGAADWLRYVTSSLVNWPDLELYGTLCRVEWQLCKSPACSAHLVPEWHERRRTVAHLKYMEGMWEACPQAILQLYLLVLDLYGHWTWTDYLRIAGACVSLCMAGAALVNYEKFTRIINYTDPPLSELVVLYVWAVSVTVSRLLSVTLLLSVHLYWALAAVALHLVLYGVFCCRTEDVHGTLRDDIDICQTTLQFCMSPFNVAGSVTYRRVCHAVHILVNTGMMVVWALETPLACPHPVLYIAIICFKIVMFAVGLVAWQLHECY